MISVLAMTLGFGTAIMILSFRGNAVASGTLRHVVQTGLIADQFRDDVALAVQAPERVAAEERNGRQLFLARADGTIVIYRFNDGRLTRAVRSGESEQKAVLARTPADESFEFDLSRLDRKLVTLRFLETRRARPQQRVDVTAAIGGDRQ